MIKTIRFAAIHFTIAFTVAYALTGEILIASMIAMLEPAVNTVAFYFHERVWDKNQRLQALRNNETIKTASFATVHFSVAFGVVYLLTGDVLAGGIMATLEPTINTIAYFFHEKSWNRKHQHTCFAH
ncbi:MULTISPECIES: DUF2061 domain-containing protein [Vibrio]|jgi:uncharacterized membrane protein|uniref:DUF2061 domain-containing protein n=2 Tax=Vibrio TaxID=662 RepID=A0ABW7IKG3_9VIBR|nr:MULTISPECIES: DUF2061 domain-containing protein [Vibrio]ASI90324.1 hypothetical protein BSZ05_11395 [Vibrio mediterranei]MCG9786233.1 DUF2061 domain-containing protein [Vibrio mediterranei]MCY9853100.1 DUF2061 domain-containing protein [Vibrio mediterranei]MCY9869930.1 DUF2061 domain-containing protein [Vibrio barjaei]OIN28675.1 hypothetical protein AWH66_2021735 [Vibrio barjaei]